jgi:hypothetical protein
LTACLLSLWYQLLSPVSRNRPMSPNSPFLGAYSYLDCQRTAEREHVEI